jgi:ketosteroid isomerase-like protein
MATGTLADFIATNHIFEAEVVGKGDFDALDRVYTSGARILPPGAEMIAGLPGIKEFWKQAAVALDVASVKLNTVDAEFLGDTAVEIGRANIHTNGDATIDVKYVVVWKLEDGAWKWHIDIWNPVS